MIYMKFQFHLMRLKESTIKNFSRFSQVSIPFDAIKRKEVKVTFDVNVTFQFHLMRLKD